MEGKKSRTKTWVFLVMFMVFCAVVLTFGWLWKIGVWDPYNGIIQRKKKLAVPTQSAAETTTQAASGPPESALEALRLEKARLEGELAGVKAALKDCSEPSRRVALAKAAPESKMKGADLRLSKKTAAVALVPERKEFICGSGLRVADPSLCSPQGTQTLAATSAQPVPPPTPVASEPTAPIRPPLAVRVFNEKGGPMAGVGITFMFYDAQGRPVGTSESLVTDDTGRVMSRVRPDTQCVYADLGSQYRERAITMSGKEPGVIRACGEVLKRPEGASGTFVLR